MTALVVRAVVGGEEDDGRRGERESVERAQQGAHLNENAQHGAWYISDDGRERLRIGLRIGLSRPVGLPGVQAQCLPLRRVQRSSETPSAHLAVEVAH